MKKWWISILAVIIIALFLVKPIFELSTNIFCDFVAEQLEKEEQERLAAIERGEIIIGKDTMLVWHDKYVLYHQAENDTLCIHYEDGNEESVIGKVTQYKKKKGILYILSDEGYVVIDENNFCRVYIAIPKEEFVSGYYEDENGKRTYISRFIDDTNIKYLESFNDFSEDEQKIFKKMEK